MTLTPANRSVLATLYPYDFVGVADADLDDVLDQWFAHDHYADNPVYTWTDNESHDQ